MSSEIKTRDYYLSSVLSGRQPVTDIPLFWVDPDNSLYADLFLDVGLLHERKEVTNIRKVRTTRNHEWWKLEEVDKGIIISNAQLITFHNRTDDDIAFDAVGFWFHGVLVKVVGTNFFNLKPQHGLEFEVGGLKMMSAI